AAVRDRRCRGGAAAPRQRRVLPVPPEVRRLRAPDGRVPDLRAAGARRDLASRARVVLPLAVPLPAAARAVILELEQIEVVYAHSVTAIQGVSLTVPERGIIALLGINGAGKTTTLRAISGFLGADDARVTRGRVLHRGRPVTGQPPHALARAGIVLVPDR